MKIIRLLPDRIPPCSRGGPIEARPPSPRPTPQWRHSAVLPRRPIEARLLGETELLRSPAVSPCFAPRSRWAHKSGMSKQTTGMVWRRDDKARFAGRLPMDEAIARVTAEVRERMASDMRLAGLRDRTQVAYALAVRDFVEFHGRSPDGLGQTEVRAWVAELMGRGLSAPRIRQHFAALRFLFVRTLGEPRPVSFLAWPSDESSPVLVLSRMEVQEILRQVRDARYRVLFTLMYATGLRLSEACWLEVQDIDSPRGLIRVRRGKGGRQRMAPMAEQLAVLLREYLRIVRPRPPLVFPSRRATVLGPGGVRKALRSAALAAGVVGKVTPHALRHAFAAHLVEAGVDVRVLQLALGHRSIRTTARYAHVQEARLTSMPSPMDWLRD